MAEERTFEAPQDPFNIPPSDVETYYHLHNLRQRKRLSSQAKELYAARLSFEDAWCNGVDAIADAVELLTKAVTRIPLPALLLVLKNPQSFSLSRPALHTIPRTTTRIRSIRSPPATQGRPYKRRKTSEGASSQGASTSGAGDPEGDGQWEDVDGAMQIDEENVFT